MSAQASSASVPALAEFTAYAKEDLALGLELAASASSHENDRTAMLRAAAFIRQLPIVPGCNRCFRYPASMERGDRLCDGCHEIEEGRHHA